jgi:hypothetical protein
MRALNQDLVLWAKRKYKKAASPSPTGSTLDRAHFAAHSGVVCSLADGGRVRHRLSQATSGFHFSCLQFFMWALQFSSPNPALQDEPEREAKSNEEDR